MELAHLKLGNHFLLVDDQPSNLFAIKLILDNYGHSYDIAENGFEAVKSFYPEKYAVIFMDLEMPVMDGYEACQKIREFEGEQNSKHTPIIIVTSNSLIDVKHKVRDLNIAHVLNKPFTMKSYNNTILPMAA